MSSDYSRLIFDRKKHYSAVRMQQGRVLLDSDWNSQHDIHQDRLHKQTVDVIGKTGVPIHSNGFQLTANTDGTFALSQGRMYVNGLLCELDETINFEGENDGVLITSQAQNLPYGLINTQIQAGAFLLYLEAWQREITYLDDPQIREKALGDPDTTTRLQTVWQLKSASIGEGQLCENIQIPLDDVGLTTTGTLEARTIAADGIIDPCSFNQTGGYRRLENQLYRVEIQTGGSLAEATYKWSRENAAIQTSVLEITGGDTIRVSSLGRDEVLGFAVGQWVALINEHLSLSRQQEPLLQIAEITRSTMEITLSGTVDHLDLEGLKIIRWEQGTQDIPLSSTFEHLEDGIEVNFSAGNYVAGDYWQIPARTIDASIEWTPGERKLPRGINVSIAKIGIVTLGDNQINSILDCRNLFPPLTELPTGGGGCSTYHVTPETGWHRVFDRIDAGEDAKICFAVGDYTLDSTVIIENKGHLLITGCGRGTVIRGTNLKVAFGFLGCASLDISNMTIVATNVKNAISKSPLNRKGVLTVINTPLLTVDKLYLTCGHGMKPLGSCIGYYNAPVTLGSVKITDCNLDVGFLQHGIVIINSKRTLVENNVIKVRPKPTKYTITDRLRADSRTRNSFVNIMMSNFSAEHNSSTNETINFENHSLSFRTNPDLRKNKLWEKMLSDNPPPSSIRNTNELKKHLKDVALREVMERENRIPQIDEFTASLRAQDTSVGFQGIVIGGSESTEIHVNRNRIEDFLQGIHVGLSHEHNSGEEYDILNSVRIENNFVKNTLTILNNYSRHGIFVGNCNKLTIKNNEIDLDRKSKADKVQIDAIKVWGFLGRKGTITDNHIYSSTRPENSYNTGIKIYNLERDKTTLYWNISWNSLLAKVKFSIPSNYFSKYLDTNN